MKRYLVGIAGGSGSGKSTLAYSLMDDYLEKVEVIHFDDYINKRQAKLLHDMHNTDHPDAIDWKKLIVDLNSLLSGKAVEVMTKSERLNPDYWGKMTKKRISHVFQPREVLILEGYLALWHPNVRKLLDYSVYLDIDFEVSLPRRTKILDNNEKYNELILRPMHKEFVEPTKAYADLVIDIRGKSREDVKEIVKTHLCTKNIL